MSLWKDICEEYEMIKPLTHTSDMPNKINEIIKYLNAKEALQAELDASYLELPDK